VRVKCVPPMSFHRLQARTFTFAFRPQHAHGSCVSLFCASRPSGHRICVFAALTNSLSCKCVAALSTKRLSVLLTLCPPPLRTPPRTQPFAFEITFECIAELQDGEFPRLHSVCTFQRSRSHRHLPWPRLCTARASVGRAEGWSACHCSRDKCT
jgi:hypothetical protein